MATIFAPISVGELLDKISILEIKLMHVGNNQVKKDNIDKELLQLIELRNSLKLPTNLNYLYENLMNVNLTIWKIEDNIRQHEKIQLFDSAFIDYARKIYINNDLRAEIKKNINLATNSAIIEEKIY